MIIIITLLILLTILLVGGIADVSYYGKLYDTKVRLQDVYKAWLALLYMYLRPYTPQQREWIRNLILYPHLRTKNRLVRKELDEFGNEKMYYCCLGMACTIHEKTGNIISSRKRIAINNSKTVIYYIDNEEKHYVFPNKSTASLLEVSVKFFNLYDGNGTDKSLNNRKSLAQINDESNHKYAWHYIAWLLLTTPKSYFTNF